GALTAAGAARSAERDELPDPAVVRVVVLPRVPADPGPRRRGVTLRETGGRGTAWQHARYRAGHGSVVEGGYPRTCRAMAGSERSENLGQRPVAVAREERRVDGVVVQGQRRLVDAERLVRGSALQARHEGILPDRDVHQVIL